METRQYTFKEAYDNLPAIEQRKVRETIMTILGVTTDMAIYQKLNNEKWEPRYSEAIKINALFGIYHMSISWPNQSK